MDDDELNLFDEHVEDCADYFATVLSEEFSGIRLEPLESKEWRKGWRVIVPAQAEFRVREVEKMAREVRDELWWGMSTLVPYVIERPED